MKITKRIISILLVLAMLLGSVTVASAAEYQDVSKKHWAKADIEWATAQGLMNGTGAGKFSPEGSAERAMLVTILYRSAGSPAVGASTPFTDLKQAWYKSAVAWAYVNGIVNGTSATTFGPSAKITREQLATILYRYTQNTLKYNVSVSGSLSKFPDGNKVSSYAKEAMLWANAVGMVNGNLKNGVSYLEPKGNATRAQLAAIFHRFETYKEANKPADPKPEPKPDPKPTTATVPNFVGMTKEQATAAATAAGLQVVFNENSVDQYDSNYGHNVVVRQLTAAGTTVAVGQAVVVNLNIAPPLFAIPDFTGMTREQATQAAVSAGFGVSFINGTYDENKAENTVLNQTPAAGAQRPAGTVIALSMNVKPPEAPPEPDATEIFRVAAYNVRHFAYGNGVNYDVFAQEINAIDPDIIGLQEIENGADRTNDDNQMQKIAEAAGYPYYYFGKSIDFQGGGYGHGILSKYPIIKSETVKFRAQTGEERTVERHEIYVDRTDDGVDNGQTVTFYNTHLAYCGEDSNSNNIVESQPNQMAEIFEMMDQDLYPILVGDMNIAPIDFKNVIDVTRYTPLNGGKGLQDIANTYPQGTASYIPIDNIILSDNIGYKSTATDPNGLNVNRTDLSDHNMVYADIWLKEDPTIQPLNRVPDVLGLTLEEAVAALKAKGYQVAYAEGSDTDPEATVLSQSVAGGTALVAGETVTLNAKRVVKVPDVTGLSPAGAKALLEAEGYAVAFVPGSETEASDAVVTKQVPAQGTELTPGETVTLTSRVLYSEYLTVASYDVKRFTLEATTGQVDYDAFVEEITALSPDILGLQAVDMETTTNGDQTKKIAEKLGYPYYYYAPAILSHNGGSFGNSILSRFPILSASGGLFDEQVGETRGYVRAVLDVNGVPVTVYNVMFTNGGSATRSAQLAQMTAMMAEDEFPILMGNLNMAPSDLNGQIDLNAYTPLNGGKGLDQSYITCVGSTGQQTYVSNIIITDQLEVATDAEHPTGLYVSPIANCWHRMIHAYVRMKDAPPAESDPGTPKVPYLIGLTVAEARAKVEAAGYVFALAEGASAEAGATVSVQNPAANTTMPAGGTVAVNTRVLYGDYLSVASFDVQKMGLTNFEPFMETIGELDPEIIAIQAIDHGTTQINVDCQLEYLAEQLGYDYYVCGSAYPYKGGYLGNGILSKFPITKQESGLFENQDGETRGWIRAEINVEGTTIVVYNAKLAHGKTAAMDALRAKQFAELYAKIRQDEFPVLMGNLSADATMLDGQLDMMRYTPLNGGKSLKDLYITASGSGGESSSSNIIISDEFEYMTDETAAPHGLYIDDDKLCDHRMISAYIRLKNSVLPENAKFIEVPDFTGLNQAGATAMAAANGLNATFRLGFDQNYIDKISAQSIEAGTRLSRGRSIELTLNIALANKADYEGWLTVASYNVQRAAGGGEYDEIAAEIRAIGADVVGIQEIVEGNSASSYKSQIKALADEAGYPYYAFGKAISLNGNEDYGHGIISKYPITKSETFMFETQNGEERSYERHEIYIDTTDDGQENGYTFAFYNTHLCLDNTKAAQNAQLAEILEKMAADPIPAVLVGDLNAEPSHLKATIDASGFASMNGGRDPNVNAITCHNGKPIDHIIISEDWDHFQYDNGLGFMVIESEWSDHNLIYTYLKLKD